MKYLRPVLFALAFATTLSVRAAADFKLEPDFVSLFNGKDLSGWCYREGDKADAKITAGFDGKTTADDGRFSANEGVLIVHAKTPRKVQKIYTQREFPKNFVLRLEFRAEVNAD